MIVAFAQRLEKMVAWAAKHSDLSERRLLNGLAKAAWTAVVVALALEVVPCFILEGVSGTQNALFYGLSLLQCTHPCCCP